MKHFHDKEGSHVFNFYGREEIETVATIFRDNIERLELLGNDSPVDPYHRQVSKWDQDTDRSIQAFRTQRPRRLLGLFREYADTHLGRVEDIMDDDEHPDMSSEERIEIATKLYKFGYYAGVLVSETQAALESVSARNEDSE